MDLSSWIRRLVEGGVGEREVAMLETMMLAAMLHDVDRQRGTLGSKGVLKSLLNLGHFYNHA